MKEKEEEEEEEEEKEEEAVRKTGNHGTKTNEKYRIIIAHNETIEARGDVPLRGGDPRGDNAMLGRDKHWPGKQRVLENGMEVKGARETFLLIGCSVSHFFPPRSLSLRDICACFHGFKPLKGEIVLRGKK